MFHESISPVRGFLHEIHQASTLHTLMYCIIDDNTLYFYTNNDDQQLSFLIHLTSITHVVPVDLLSFRLHLNDRSIRTFQCETVIEQQRWMSTIAGQTTRINVTINDFELIRLIGEGGFGSVFLARMKANDSLFAIKEIRKSRISSMSHQSHVIAERNVLIMASHQFITKLHYAFQTPSKFYFVLEFVPGGNLSFHINRGIHFSPEQIRLYLAEIVIALKTLHQLGIIYRDLKPDNILIDKNGHLKLSDFGLACLINSDSSNSLCGTRDYMSPEMLRGDKQTFAIDWWALGILAFLLHFNYLPFDNENTLSLYERIKKSDPRIPRNTDPTIASFIRQLLAKDPTMRLSDNDVMSHPYFHGLPWIDVQMMFIQPQFIPAFDTPDSLANFDQQYTSKPLHTFHSEPDSSVVIHDFDFDHSHNLTPVTTSDDLHSSSEHAMTCSC
jgi:serine/threonine protein kinase